MFALLAALPILGYFPEIKDGIKEGFQKLYGVR